jgi:hypothetical protein
MHAYLIEKHGAGNRAHWMVKVGCELHGDYLSEWSAVLDAIDAAHEDGENDLDAEVRIARDDGSQELAWRVGDAYPRHTMLVSNDNPGTHCRSA